ncbi:MAG: helix-turn-helix transcriptional regulator [Gammaproteobacteria bacterium]|nr:MAG: helix-turn-helix transcriptional regulator [Gammaproteobacteria bacterium]
MIKNNIRTFNLLSKLHEQEKKFKRELSKTFLEYLDNLPPNKRIEQMEALLYEAKHRNLPTLDRRLTPQERKCLYLASKGKEIKKMASILGLSQRTIKYHRANIIKKLEVPNLTAAVAIANQSNTAQDMNNRIKFGASADFQMLSRSIIAGIPEIAALGKFFPVNLFLINKDGKICWANEHMLKVSNQSELKAIQGKHVRMFGEKKWLTTKNVFTSNKKAILFERFQQKIFFTIKVPHNDNDFQGVFGLSFDVTALKKTGIAKQKFLINRALDLKKSLKLLNLQTHEINQANRQDLLQLIRETRGQLLKLLNSINKLK